MTGAEAASDADYHPGRFPLVAAVRIRKGEGRFPAKPSTNGGADPVGGGSDAACCCESVPRTA
jgi:hypothetical protein